jgi:hypothetical protein
MTRRRAFEIDIHQARGTWTKRLRCEIHPDDAVADLAQRYARILRCLTSLYLVPSVRRYADPPWPPEQRKFVLSADP